jgi:CHAT domain-containing protein
MFRQLLSRCKKIIVHIMNIFADVRQWGKLNQQVTVLYQQGDYKLAIPLAEKALELARSVFHADHVQLGITINNLAELYHTQGEYSIAEPLWVEYFTMCQRLFGNRDNDNLANSLNNLAGLYYSQKNFIAAEPLYVEALEMRRRLFRDRDNYNLANSLNNLASTYKVNDKYNLAEPLYLEALAMQRRLSNNRDHVNPSISINNLGTLYNSQRKYDLAESLFIEALAMQRRLFSDRDNEKIANSLNNLAFLYWEQEKHDLAKPLFIEALSMRRRLFDNPDNHSLANSLNNLAFLYIAQQQLERAFSIMIEATEVEENILCQWFGYSTESNRLRFVETNQLYLQQLLSLLCQYFPDDSEKIAQVAIAVARRKAFAAQAEVELNYLRYSDRYPDLTADFRELATAQGKLTHLNHTYYHHRGAMDDGAREAHHQAKQTLTEQIDRLERKLSANVPELRQLQQHVTLPAIFAALPDDSCAIEFYRFDVYNFAGDGWQDPQYVAFILAPGGKVGMVKLGDAGEIDRLIDRYRDLAGDVNLPSFGARPKAANSLSKAVVEVEDITIDRQLSDRLVMPILETIGGEIKQLIFIPDGAVNFLPIGNLLVGSETRLFEKVGFLGASLGERFVCTYLSTLRELLTRTDRPNRSLNPSIAIGNPNYDYPHPVTISPALATAGISMLRQLGTTFSPIPESELLLDALKLQLTPDAKFFTGDRATANVLQDAKSPKSLVIITHGYLLNGNRESAQSIDPMQSHGLALAGANTWLEGKELPAEIGKGFLLARDVAYLDLLGTKIVFLIACSSGLGDVKTGEGVFGLRRAFAIAGVKTLITSLWNVPTRPTMLLTDRFFEAYHRGVVPAIALQSAQQYVRDISRIELESTKLGEEILAEVDRLSRCGVQIVNPNYPLRHPYFWGAWICQGV